MIPIILQVCKVLWRRRILTQKEFPKVNEQPQARPTSLPSSSGFQSQHWSSSRAKMAASSCRQHSDLHTATAGY